MCGVVCVVWFVVYVVWCVWCDVGNILVGWCVMWCVVRGRGGVCVRSVIMVYVEWCGMMEACMWMWWGVDYCLP